MDLSTSSSGGARGKKVRGKSEVVHIKDGAKKVALEFSLKGWGEISIG